MSDPAAQSQRGRHIRLGEPARTDRLALLTGTAALYGVSRATLYRALHQQLRPGALRRADRAQLRCQASLLKLMCLHVASRGFVKAVANDLGLRSLRSSRCLEGRMDISKIAAPVLAALVVGIIAVISVWMQEPWLAPSLGSAALAQTISPDQPTSKPYSVAVGQLLGAVAGFAGVFIAGTATLPMFMGDHDLVLARAGAAALALLLAAALQLACKATTPAGGATAVVVAIGAETANWSGVLHLAVGILLVTALGEAARQAILKMRATES